MTLSVECLSRCYVPVISNDAEECLYSKYSSRELLLAQAIGEIVIRAFDAQNTGLWQRQRGDASIALIRQISMYLAHVVCGLNFTQIGAVFQRDRTTVSHACCVIEDRRDSQDFDRTLDTLEFGILCLLDSGFYRSLSDIGGGVQDDARN